jgi:hypothetical protein
MPKGSGPPRAVTEAKAESRPLILACYADMEEGCQTAREKLKNCKPPVAVKELPKNSPRAEYDKAIESGLLNGTPVVVIGHGAPSPLYKEGATYDEVDRAKEVHKLGMGGYDRFEKKTGRGTSTLSVPKGVATESIRDSLFSGKSKPALWVSACRSGMVCDAGYCIGGSCQADEDSSSSSKDGGLNLATQTILDLYCDEKLFSDADADKNGELTGTELAGYFCTKAKGGRPFLLLYANTKKIDEAKQKVVEVDYEENKKKLQELVELLIDETQGAITTEGRKRLGELEVENGEYPDTKFVYEKDADSLRKSLRIFLPKFRGVKNLRSKIKWTEDKTDYASSVDGEPLNSLLKLEFPAPNDQACIWTAEGRGGTFRYGSYTPNLENFSLRFRPSPSAVGGGAAKTDSEHGDQKE